MIPYREYLKTEAWKKVSAAVKSRDGYRCRVCNDSRNLVAHHRTYRNLGNEMDFLGDLTCLCQSCHERFHDPKEVAGKMVATRMPRTYGGPAVSKSPLGIARARSISGAERPLPAISPPIPIPTHPLDIKEILRIPKHRRTKQQKKEVSRLKRLARLAKKEKRRNISRMAKERNAKHREATENNKASTAYVASLYNHESDMPEAFPYVATKQFVNFTLKTKAGGYTNATLRAIGVQIPPVSGWPKEVIGKELTEEQCRAALRGRETRSTFKTLLKAGVIKQEDLTH